MNSLCALIQGLVVVETWEAGVADGARLAELAVGQVAFLAAVLCLVPKVALLAGKALVLGTVVAPFRAFFAHVFDNVVPVFAAKTGQTLGGRVGFAEIAVGKGLLAWVAGAFGEVEPVLAAGALAELIDGGAIGDVDVGASVGFGVEGETGLAEDALLGPL
jgi:hypothetical protein